MADKSDKRVQTVPFQVRMTELDRACLNLGNQLLATTLPKPLGLGPFMVWAAKQKAAELLGITVKELEERAAKPAKKRAAR